MATKKKAKKKSVKSMKTARKKPAPPKNRKRPQKLKKKPAPKSAKKKSPAKKKPRKKNEPLGSPVFLPKAARASAGGQSGDLQGLSRREAADSESVDELIEEGNAFEADAVMGVEDADNADEQEVHTHEVPEDDVPGEYLDEE